MFRGSKSRRLAGTVIDNGSVFVGNPKTHPLRNSNSHGALTRPCSLPTSSNSGLFPALDHTHQGLELMPAQGISYKSHSLMLHPGKNYPVGAAD